MKINSQVVKAMGVCKEGCVWFEDMFGKGSVSPSDVFKVINARGGRKDADGWIRFVNNLKTNPDAIQCSDNHIKLNDFKLEGPGILEKYTTKKKCTDRISEIALLETSRDKTLGILKPEIHVVTSSGTVVLDYSQRKLKSWEKIYVNSDDKTLNTSAAFEKYIKANQKKRSTEIKASFSIHRRIREPDENFYAWMKV